MQKISNIATRLVAKPIGQVVYELFDLKATKYLSTFNTFVEMPLNCNVQRKAFAFVTSPDHIRNELLKLNNL